MDTLDLLVQQPFWRMGDLADALRVDPSTATRAVQRLERFGLASRCNSPSDKRVVMVSITDDGRARHAEAAHRRQEVITHMLGVFDRDEFEQLASYMERFVGALDDFVAEVGESAKKN
jgi:DNA-binding MarR family transcriptional regulator